MTTASMWAATVDALLVAFAGATTVPVFDGIPVTYAELPLGVAVGVDGAYDNGTSGEFRQDWRDAGPAPWAHRDETGEIACTIWAQNGGDDLAALRTQVFDLLTALSAVIHTVNTLDPRLVDAHILRGDPIQRRTSGGVVCEVAFRVAYRAIFT